MASWSYKIDLNPLFGLRQPVYLDGNIYFIDNRYTSPQVIDQNPAGIIYEYDPVANGKTAILTPASFTDHYSTWSIASFKGDLYAAIWLFIDPDDILRVYRWDGTPENWTQVLGLDATTSSEGIRYTRLYADDSAMFLYGRSFLDGEGYIRYTSDGSSWNVGSIPSLFASISFMENDKVTWWPLGIYERACNSNDSPSNSCDDIDVYVLAGSGMSIFQASPPADYHQSAPATRHTATQGYYSMPLDMSTVALIDDPAEAIGCARSVNAMANLVGVEISGTDTKLYLYAPATNTFGALFETMTTSAGVNPNFNPDSTWFVNGTSNAWLVGQNASTGNWEVWERNAAFDLPTATLAEFWYGVNTPTYRSDLPFGGVNPGAMAINPAGNVAVVGGDEAGGQIVVYSPADFTAWTNMSGGMATGSAVTSVKYV